MFVEGFLEKQLECMTQTKPAKVQAFEKLNAAMQMFTPEENGNAEEFLAAIRKRTDPFQSKLEPSPVPLHPSPAVKGLRAMLTEAKIFLAEVRLREGCLPRKYCNMATSQHWQGALKSSQ